MDICKHSCYKNLQTEGPLYYPKFSHIRREETVGGVSFFFKKDLPVEGISSLDVHNKLKEASLTWKDKLKGKVDTLRTANRSWQMVEFNWSGGK